ncbi:MAG: DegT/DnrJ/EryC1/StrS family aminotransferase [Chloroflexota bacterium]|nr:DegT/DnrJ/EryC1/StrS family aminotransferase [Chloroflexota bacterium]
MATRQVPFNVLAPGVQAIRPELDAAIARVLDRGWFLEGPELHAFEEQFAAYHGPDLEAVGVGSGTDALRIGLLALGTQPGDEVLVVANAGIPPVAAVVAAGARPVFCDVDPRTQTLDPVEIGRRATPRTRAVLVVHLFGQPASMDAIVASARAHGLKVLEDCAQAHGARYAGRPVGTLGDAAAFSFYPTKNLGALGDAGAVLSADAHVAEQASLLRSYGWRQRYLSEFHSTVSRLDELQAALLLAKLPHLDSWNSVRRRIAQRYRDQLDGLLEPPPESGVFHLFVVRSVQRDALRGYLAERGVSTAVHYPVPAHLQAPYAAYGGGPGSLPNTERLGAEILSLPIHPELSDEDVDYVASQVRAFSASHGT